MWFSFQIVEVLGISRLEFNVDLTFGGKGEPNFLSHFYHDKYLFVFTHPEHSNLFLESEQHRVFFLLNEIIHFICKFRMYLIENLF